MDSDEAILNSCLVCRVPNQEGEFEFLYSEDQSQLSAAGQLYEELVGVQIESSTADFYPQYLCNSCDLQMKLFKKLKTKAYKTLQDLKKQYEIVRKENCLQDHQDEEVDDLVLVVSQDTTIEAEPTTEDEEVVVKVEQDGQESIDEIQFIDEKAKNVSYFELLDGGYKINVEELEYLDDLESEIIDNQLENKETQKIQANNQHSCDLIPVDGEEFKPYGGEPPSTTDIDNFDAQAEYAEILDDTSQETTGNDEENIFLDVHYLDTLNDKEEKLQNKYYCNPCDILFYKKIDFHKHRKQNHFSKYPCSECDKVFQTTNALRVHVNLHRGLPAYQCELCSKTFNQKVHLTYHMAKHNNVRNFKCEICAKAFIAKGDLSIHMRCHTNERRYACDICKKEFLMHEHMKNHRFSHFFEKKFECKICKQKFVSPSTLRTHTKSIHEDEPRFQCAYCVKKFRRKHHLEAHYKVHRKIRLVAVEDYEEPISNCEDESMLIVTED